VYSTNSPQCVTVKDLKLNVAEGAGQRRGERKPGLRTCVNVSLVNKKCQSPIYRLLKQFKWDSRGAQTTNFTQVVTNDPHYITYTIHIPSIFIASEHI